MQKYRIRCQAENGEILNEYFLMARNDKEAAVKNHRHPEYERSAFMALEKGIYEYQYVIDPVINLN